MEPRLYIAGERKSLLDPFLPAREEDVARLRAVQAELHERFKAWVRERRCGRSKGDEALLFSGEFWTGAKAVALDLADGIGEVRSTMRARHGEDERFAVFGGLRRPWWTPLLPSPEGLVEAAMATIEQRAAYARLGL